MPNRSRVAWTVVLAAGLWALVVPAASAYIDPGSTSFVFQALIAFAMAAGLTLKTFWRRIRSFFGRASRGDSVTAEQDTP